jgi:ribosomal protein S1
VKLLSEQSAAVIEVGDQFAVTVTKVLPFGVLVETKSGVAGMVTNLQKAVVGDTVTVLVDRVDEKKHRFSGTVR